MSIHSAPSTRRNWSVITTNPNFKKFEESIYFKDNTYYVDLPWYEDKMKMVPSNYQVVLKVLDKTVKYLQSKKLYKEYNDAFLPTGKGGNY